MNFNKNYFYLIIFIVWTFFFYFNFITKWRLIYFFAILIIIVVYKFIISLFNHIILKKSLKFDLLIFINKIKNPIFSLLLKLEGFLLKISLKDKIFLNYIIFLIFLFFLNPIKIFFYKFYNILLMWKETDFFDLLFGRMFGLILSILIFTNIITFFKELFNVDIFGLIYIYLLMISLIIETVSFKFFFEKKSKIYEIFRILFLIPEINLQAIFNLRKKVNLLSIVIYNNSLSDFYLIYERNFKITYKNLFNFSYMILGQTYFCLNIYKYIKAKSPYFLYLEVFFFIQNFCIYISDYVFLLYHNFNFPSNFLEAINKTEINLYNYKLLMDFKFKVFKLILFIYYDIAEYFDQNIKKVLVLNQFFDLNYFELNSNLILEKKDYMLLLKNNKKILWDEEFMLLLFRVLNKFNLFKKFDALKSSVDIEYLNYRNLNILSDDINQLKLFTDLSMHNSIEFFSKFLVDLYDEYQFLKNYNKKLYYETIIKELDITYSILFESKKFN